MTLEELRNIAREETERHKQFKHRIHVCVAAGCLSSRSDQVKIGLEAELHERGLEKTCQVKGVGCMGLCAAGPLVMVDNQIMYQNVQPVVDGPDCAELIDSLDSRPVERIALSTDLSFFKDQKKIVLENSGNIDPERIEEYIMVGGYEALLTALTTMSPVDVVTEITRSGLRGRGGAGFPTGLKWSTVAKAGTRANEKKYVICNADEGDPGAFMDRSVLESDPHRVLEGMALAAYAVGADQGYIYCRAEYPLAVKRLKLAIKQAENLGLLGNNIADSRFSLKIEVRLGAGAFVCGEETALIASIEGKRGMPRPRPPYPAQEGLWNCPTLINNVETYANVAPIIRNGGDWFASIGTEKSKGTKVFALAGRVTNTGLIEVPMGITLRDIIYKLGGGIPDGKKFKAVQTGGPSGGCIPEEFLDMPVDYESLAKLGAIMGSGGMIIMDETSCMVDVAKYFMDFCRSESCGKCIPCRTGTAQMHELLTKITECRATEEDLALLQLIGEVVKSTSLCGLGQTAPNPVGSTLRYFKHEYDAHIKDHECCAGVCKPKAAEVNA
jgi:bidirectional [NiFe] hydrogenase diaphorase subunit